MDRDTMKHIRDFERVLGGFRSGEIDILVGTQMIAKGHDFPASRLWESWAPMRRSRCRTFVLRSARFSC
jgi:hypothetical protein